MITFDQLKANWRKLDLGDEINSQDGLHCPHCGNFHDASDLPGCDYPEVWSEDDSYSTKFECHECEQAFVFRTAVNYEWYVRKPAERTPND